MRNFLFPVSRNHFAALAGASLLILTLSSGVNAANPAPPDFEPGMGIIGNAEVAVVLPDGKILACRNTFPRPDRLPIVRLNADGTSDATFSVPDLGISYVFTILPLANGQTLLGAVGSGDADGDEVLRLNADGSLDTTFTDDGSSYRLWDQMALPDGKILLTTFSDHGTSGLIRLNVDGSLDPTFSATVPADFTFKVEAGGDILILSSESDGDDEDGPGSVSLLRLGPDGTSKGQFDLLTLTGGSSSVLLPLADGKIALAVRFSDDDDNDLARVFRLNADGTLDATFDNGVVFDGSINTLSACPDGALLVGGWFGKAGDTARNGLARLKADGTLDTLYDPANAITGNFSQLVFTPAGEIYALVIDWNLHGGGTTTYTLDHFDGGGSIVEGTSITGSTFSFSLVARPDGAGVYLLGTPDSDFSVFSARAGGVTISPPPAPGGGIITARQPAVTVSAVRSKVYAGSKVPGKFIVRRAGADLSQPLRIVYRVQGSAVAGRDYRSVRRERVIPAGRRVARISIRPVGRHFDRPEGGRAHVTIRLLPRDGYRLGTERAAKVKFIDSASAPQG